MENFWSGFEKQAASAKHLAVAGLGGLALGSGAGIFHGHKHGKKKGFEQGFVTGANTMNALSQQDPARQDQQG